MVNLAVTPDGSRLYITNDTLNDLANGGTTHAKAFVVDTATDQVIDIIKNSNNFGYAGIVFTLDGARAYVTNPFADTAVVLDTGTNTPLATIGVGLDPEGIVISPDASRIYVANSGSKSVSVIDTSRNLVIDTITGVPSFGLNAFGMAIATLNQSTISLSPTSLTFPTTLKGAQSAPQIVTLTNTGTAAVTINSITVTTSGDFHSHNTCPASLAAGADCTITVIFRPQAKGPRTGTVTITDSAAGSPQTVALTGTGTILTFSPPSIDFGDQAVSTSTSQTVTMSNHSGSPVTITTLTIKGMNLNDFSQTNNCGTSLAGNSSCTITVTFAPTKTGARSASVWISDDGGGSPQIIPLSGNGT